METQKAKKDTTITNSQHQSYDWQPVLCKQSMSLISSKVKKWGELWKQPSRTRQQLEQIVACIE